ncbi:MAG: glutamate-5-semialdehyde dehydrogenase [Candidatus Schekmanbacteria bacterium]|nr:MAG: glutamate-5-semialdehyde dehydrogenase [Candidatus Schekmanbacteria bacterium]
MSIEKELEKNGKLAREAGRKLSVLSTEVKNRALLEMAKGLETNYQKIIKANKEDLKNAKKNNLTSAMIDRLKLDKKRIEKLAQSVRNVASLPDPCGEIVKMWKRPNGLLVGRMRVPVGVIGIIYESRPGVTAEAVSLCIKSGNAIILRGGSEAFNSNCAIANILAKASRKCKIPKGAIQIINTIDRRAVFEMLKLDKYIDMIIPRGGEGLINFVKDNSRIPVICHDKGLCTTYVDSYADLDMAVNVSFNAKVQRPGVCNAMETLLVHKDIAKKFLPLIAKKFQNAGVEMRGCNRTKKILPKIKSAVEEDFNREFLELKLAVKIVDSLDEAIEHINTYSSHHSDAIITENYSNAQRFIREIDSSSVFVNASTRFADGGEYGLGAEMGISTQKLHCRGPMGLEELTTTKFIVYGEGQVRN